MGSASFTFWRAPLVPVALFLTAGIVVDRHFEIPLFFSFGFTFAAWLAWFTLHRAVERGLSLLYLWAACVGLGALYHHWYLFAIPVNDVRHLATTEAKPARLRGVIHSEPTYTRGSDDEPLRFFPSADRTRFVLAATHILDGSDWLEVSGLVQLTLQGSVKDIHVGDRLEAAGRLQLPEGAANPGGFDYREAMAYQGIGALLKVPADAEAVVLVKRGWPRNIFGWLAVIRAWGQEQMAAYLPERYRGLAGALLLGEGTGMTRDDWDKYMRTGVIHVLAISGQHLVVLAAFLWFFLRLARLSHCQSWLVIACVLPTYALLVGARPPVMRAAWVALIYCGGALLQRRVLSANAFALGWIGVLIANPADMFTPGCQLTFLAVAVLLWGTEPAVMSLAFLFQTNRPETQEQIIQRLIEQSRPVFVQIALRWFRWLMTIYLVNMGVFLAVSPLVAQHFNSISPVGLVLGPPLVLLTSIALMGGFMVLFWAPIFSPFAALAGGITTASLVACDTLVEWAISWPGAFFFVTDVASWWLYSFYLGLFAYLTVDQVRLHARSVGWLGVFWLALGLFLVLWPQRSTEFRCTFLAVGHGGCTVIETPGGKTLLYDAGAIGGPDVTRRHIAPYLWSRGIRNIDEVFLSHADLDHFNGLVQLCERFGVKRISSTPTFADRSTHAVAFTVEEVNRRGIPMRVLKAGDVFDVDGIRMEVLHPPAVMPRGGPPENENSRSLVIDVRYQGFSVLLTGDLEGPGLDRLLSSPTRKLDVLMAPHHGSVRSKREELAAWARPQIVVSCQGPPKSLPRGANPYATEATRYLATWNHGAVTFSQTESAWIVETFLTKKHWKLNTTR